ncbi:hypothetical protein JKP88DRAFT_294078 [Tribonema minus]|uniref:Uncharacterized protein n=1 Tax=Tribonema minus TaxID=303371 RepID=A0A835ZCZ0_9STRA|nr:hypothetical protein JKP88DRAFT_294078 [Tribonema minus]
MTRLALIVAGYWATSAMPVLAAEDPTSAEDYEPTVRGDQVRVIIDNAKAFGSLQSDVRTLMENGASKEGLEGVRKDVTRIESTLGNCATKEAVAEIKAAVDNCATKEAVAGVKDGITRVEQAVTSCATKEAVAGVKGDISRVEQAVNNCASKDAVASVQEAVNNCATKDTVASVKEDVAKCAQKEDVRKENIYQLSLCETGKLHDWRDVLLLVLVLLPPLLAFAGADEGRAST